MARVDGQVDQLRLKVFNLQSEVDYMRLQLCDVAHEDSVGEVLEHRESLRLSLADKQAKMRALGVQLCQLDQAW